MSGPPDAFLDADDIGSPNPVGTHPHGGPLGVSDAGHHEQQHDVSQMHHHTTGGGHHLYGEAGAAPVYGTAMQQHEPPPAGTAGGVPGVISTHPSHHHGHHGHHGGWLS